MSSQEFINHRKDDEMMRVEILTNVCRMLVLRGNLDISKYCFDKYIHSQSRGRDSDSRESDSRDSDSRDSDPGSESHGVNFDDVNYHHSSMIDDSKFQSMIKAKSDKDVYVINLDTPFELEKKGLDGDNFNGNKLIISIIPHKISDVKNSDMINEVFKNYTNQHKMFIIDEVVDVARATLVHGGNVEVFQKDKLTADIMSQIRAPHRCKLDKGGKNVYIINANLARMHENDPLAKYYNAKVGDVLEIIGNSISNGFERRYRKIIDAKNVFGK
jgi:hypothetical protein